MPDLLRDRLRQARISEGLSQKELADKLGISQPLISNWEVGNFEPNPGQLAKLEGVLGGLSAASFTGNETQQLASPPTNAFGAWLSRARSEAKMSVPELARASGISPVAIYNIESGRSQNPQSETKNRLEEALNRSIPEDVKSEAAEEQKIEGLGALTDFDPHDRAALPTVAGVYVFYDISERPIYIGKAANISDRVNDHSEKFWFRSPIVFNAS